MEHSIMDFGKILDDWDNLKIKKKTTKRSRAQEALEAWLDANPEIGDVPDHDDWTHENTRNARDRTALRRMAPQDSLDLHGVRVKDVDDRVNVFLKESRENGYKKVQIIHGKGNHSQNGPVLLKAVGETLRGHPLAGEIGFSEKKHGGRGATWVIIR